MVGSEISFSLLVIFFLAAVVLMCIVYLLRKMMDRREYFEKILKHDYEILYLHGLKVSEYFSTGAIARFYDWIGQEFYGALATLTMMMLESNPTTKLYQGVFIKGDKEIERHFWAEFEVPMNGVYVADFCWLSKGFCRKKEYENLLKRNEVRLEAWHKIEYDEFWDLPLANILYEKMLDPMTSNLMDKFDMLYEKNEEWLFFSSEAYKPKEAYYEEELEEIGNYMVPFCYKGKYMISRKIIRDFAKKPTRLQPKKKHIREAIGLMKNHNAAQDEDLPFL